MVQRQKGLGSLKSSGLVGMSPYHQVLGGDLFLVKMKETGTIDAAMFSLSIGMGNVQSKITFGGYNTSLFASGPVDWHDIRPGSMFWKLPMSGLEYTSKKSNITYNYGHSDEIIVDSGTSYVLMPKADLDTMVLQMENEIGI